MPPAPPLPWLTRDPPEPTTTAYVPAVLLPTGPTAAPPPPPPPDLAFGVPVGGDPPAPPPPTANISSILPPEVMVKLPSDSNV